MGWTNSNEIGDVISKAWAEEIKSAIVIHDGITTSQAEGRTITFTTPFTSADDYAVEMTWQEWDAGNGELYILGSEKLTNQVTIRNSGSTYGKKFYYRIKAVKSL